MVQPRVLIAGAGAMGTIIGALLTHAGHDVQLLDTNVEHVAALNQNDAKIIGQLQITVPVTAILPEQLGGHYDLVVSTTKQTELQTSLQSLLPHLHANSTVLTLQNGIPEDLATQVVGPQRVIGGGMEFSATFIAPGVSELASSPEHLGLTIGTPSGEITPALQAAQQVLQDVGNCALTTQLRAVRYTKLIDNCVCSAVPTALGCILGKALDDKQAMLCIAHLGRECAAVLQAMDITPPTLFGFCPSSENLDFDSATGLQRVIDYWRTVYAPFRDQRASMLQDIEQHRLCEVDFINGKMLHEARKLDVPMPMNKRVIKCIQRLATGEPPLEKAWSNLAYLEQAIN